MQPGALYSSNYGERATIKLLCNLIPECRLMSTTVLLIALIPGFAVALVAFVSRSAVWTTLAALVAAGVGVLSGSPAYMVLDVVVVGLLYWFSMKFFVRTRVVASPKTEVIRATHPPKTDVKPAPQDFFTPLPQEPKSNWKWRVVWAILLFSICLFLAFATPPSNKQPDRATNIAPMQLPR